jgi:hypothetical protein
MKPSFDVIEMTYANTNQGFQLTVGVDNSQPTSNPKAALGPKLLFL